MDARLATARDTSVRDTSPGKTAWLTGSLLVHVFVATVLLWTSSMRRPAMPTDSIPVEMIFGTQPPAAPDSAPDSVPDSAPHPAPDPAPDLPRPAPLPLEMPPEPAAASPPTDLLPVATSPEEASADPVVPLQQAVPAPVPAENPPTPPARLVEQRPAPARMPRPPAAAARPAPRPKPAPDGSAVVPATPRPEPPTLVSTGIDPGWRKAVSTWLLEHKRYPDAARRRGEAGAVGVTFTIARDGRVSAVVITSSSGSPLLDDAVSSLLDRQQLPSFPVAMQQAQEQVSVKLVYKLEN